MLKSKRLIVILLSAFLLFEDVPLFADMIDVGRDTSPPVEVKINQGEVGLRYKLSQNAAGSITSNTDQERLLIDVSLLFFKGVVRIDIEGNTGSTFEGSWATSGVLNGNPQLDFFIRRLSMSVDPISGLEITAGSMAPEFGAGTENTSMDGDGYIMGYRIKAKISQGDLVVTGGYLGDFKNPNVFNRLSRMSEFNYLQMMWTQSIGTMIQASLEYDRVGSADLGRAAIKLDTTSFTKLLDLVQVEGLLGIDPGLNDADRAALFTLKISKTFKDVFGQLLPGRKLQTALSYVYSGGKLDFPIGDKVFKDHQIRFTASVPNLYEIGDHSSLGAYIDLIKSFTDLSLFRAEIGMILKF